MPLRSKPLLTMIASGALLVSLALHGCSGRTIRSENPVVGPAPPRVNLAQQQRLSEGGLSETLSEQPALRRTADVSTVSYESGGTEQIDPLAEVVARVNGEPIFASEVLERFGPKLAQAKAQLSADQYQKLRLQVIEQELPSHLDRAVLVTSLKQMVTPEQLDQVRDQIAAQFEGEIDRMMEQLGTSTILELEAELQKGGLSLGAIQRNHENQQLAGQYLSTRLKQPKTVTRDELLAYYQEHIDEYTTPAQTKWQQLWVSYGKHGGKEEAFVVLEQAIEELRQGAEFGAVVRKFSDGPFAEDGGHWDWTRRGSLSSKEAEQVLFSLRIGEISQVLVTDKAYQIIKVTDFRAKETKAFEKLQGEIRQTLLNERQEEAITEALEAIRAEAVVETIFNEKT